MSSREPLPARLRKATENYELLPIVSFAEWVHRIKTLCDEAAVEMERLAHVEPAIEMLTAEREAYRMRWLSCVRESYPLRSRR